MKRYAIINNDCMNVVSWENKNTISLGESKYDKKKNDIIYLSYMEFKILKLMNRIRERIVKKAKAAK